MNKAWINRRLGEALELAVDRVPVQYASSYRWAGVYSFGRGLFSRGVVQASATKYKWLHRLHADDFVMGKLKAWEGAVAVVPPAFDGFMLSPEFPTYRIDRHVLLPEFLRVLCTTPSFWDGLQGQSRGMGGRRERVNPDQLLKVEVPLPAVSIQRRIVDLISAVGRADQAALRVQERAAVARTALLNTLQTQHGSAEQTSLPTLLMTARAGGTPSRANAEFYRGAIPWLKSGEVRNDAIFSTEEHISEAALVASSAWLVPAGAVVVAMYGATAGAVGQLARPMATNQAVLALVVNEARISSRFLYHWLSHRTAAMKERAVGAAQPNLSKERVLEEPIPVLGLDEQAQWTDLQDALLRLEKAASNISERLQVVRQGILSELLSGDRRIPESYDDLLEA
jgi:type I restriction enzyme S subunit